jgi:aspartyl-tRNA(Asn)/glutamyl-tRNA(Gln) amidotransferase subunit C
MSAEIDPEQVRHIAGLARLSLSPSEVALFSEQLGKILEYVRQLERVDLAGVEPLAHPLPVVNVLRDDEPHACFDAETALRNAPARADDFFKVPAILDPTGGA